MANARAEDTNILAEDANAEKPKEHEFTPTQNPSEKNVDAFEEDASFDCMKYRSNTTVMGPWTADDIKPGEPYELDNGNKIECMGTGQRGSRANGAGFMVLDSDPVAPPAGVDAGVSPMPKMLRAPDIAVGGLADEPGWSKTAPPLCVEYADKDQDERALQKKIVDLLECGTQFIWVVRMAGPRRVEVYRPGLPVRIARPGEELDASPLLKNPVPVLALYDRDAAHRHTLRNLLQREGYENLDAVKAAGRVEGRVEGREEGRAAGREVGREEGRLIEARAALRRVLSKRRLDLSAEQNEQIETCISLQSLERWLDQAIDAGSAALALRS